MNFLRTLKLLLCKHCRRDCQTGELGFFLCLFLVYFDFL
jgi:hypothetical protein